MEEILVRAVFFDFFDTLIYWAQPLHITIRRIAERYQLDLDWSRYPEARRIMEQSYESSDPTVGVLENIQRQFDACGAFLQLLGVRDMLEQITWEVLQYEHALFSRNNAALYDDVVPLLEQLQQAGLAMAIVSNWDTTLHNMVDELGISDYFDAIVASHDQRVQSAKPDHGIFEYALQALDVSPAEVIHVGDSYESDIVGAGTSQIRAVLLDRKGLHDGRWPETIPDLLHLPQLL